MTLSRRCWRTPWGRPEILHRRSPKEYSGVPGVKESEEKSQKRYNETIKTQKHRTEYTNESHLLRCLLHFVTMTWYDIGYCCIESKEAQVSMKVSRCGSRWGGLSQGFVDTLQITWEFTV